MRVLVPLAAAAAAVAVRAFPVGSPVVGPALAALALITAVGTAARLVAERPRGTVSWAAATAAAVLVAATALTRPAGPASLADPTSRWLLPAASACLALALVTVPRPGSPRPLADHPWRRLVWDLAVAVAAVVAVAGQDVLRHTGRWSGPTLTAVVVHLAAEAVLVAAAVLALCRLRGLGGPSLECLLPLVGGALALAACDLVFVAQAMAAPAARAAGHADGARWLAVGFLAVLGGLGVSALAGTGDLPVSPRRSREMLAALALPLLAGAVLVRSVVAVVQGERLQPAAVAAGVALAGCLLVRYAYARLDQLTLARTLEARVAERTLGLGTREQWFRALVQNSSDVLTVVDVDGVVKYQSPSMTRVFGHDPAVLVGTPLSYLLRPTDAERLQEVVTEARATPRATYTIEFAIWHREGRWCDTETTVTSLLEDKDIRGLVLNTRDISERKRLEDALTHQAFHDTLTGLANRALFQDRVAHALGNGRGANTVAVLFLDLDGFKGVNDTQGHAVGDVLLGLVAERLKHCVRPSDTVARLGGDEFAVLVEDADCTRASVWVAERIVATVGQPFLLDGRELSIGVSVGIALNSLGRESDDVLLRNADVAMYRAKARREGGWVRFESGMRDALVEKMELENDLKLALGRGQLAVYYQPTVELARGLVVGAEALLRWHHPVRGLIAPDEFIGLAEESGLIAGIGEYVLREACAAGARWQVWAPPGQPFHVAVNISARQLSAALVETVQRALADSGLPPRALVLELTESILVERTDEVLALLNQLKALGVRLAIDDFGTGYSSLSYLSRFPVDILKIDRSFVEAVAVEGSEQGELARHILHLGQSMHLATVAEGIESNAQYTALRAMGCDYGQGYLFARALPVAGLDELLSCRPTTPVGPSATPMHVPPLAPPATPGG